MASLPSEPSVRTKRREEGAASLPKAPTGTARPARRPNRRTQPADRLRSNPAPPSNWPERTRPAHQPDLARWARLACREEPPVTAADDGGAFYSMLRELRQGRAGPPAAADGSDTIRPSEIAPCTEPLTPCPPRRGAPPRRPSVPPVQRRRPRPS